MPRDTIKIEGVTYDITNFKHPGGNIIHYAKNSPDATEIFREFHHRSTKASKLLRSLPVCKDGEVNESSRTHRTPARNDERFPRDATEPHRPRML